MEFKIIAKTFQGLEEVLAQEIKKLGAKNVTIGNRMVSFMGDQEMLYRANFCLRTAVKILKPIREFKADDADIVYEIVKQMDWSEYMDEKTTFLVDSVVFSDNFRHSKFVAYRVKDAIADYFRERSGERPNVSISNPDIRINVHIATNTFGKDIVTISLDSSGESLHKRGYRKGTVAAPLNEVLAAGMILLSGWDGECDFIDPFCGSGTILIEAALIAQNIYPGVFREEYAFERWKDFDQDLLERIYNDDSQEREFDHKIYGYDINRQAVAIAQENVRSAGVQRIVEVQQQDFYEFEWSPLPTADDADVAYEPRKAIMMTNPPYGERITTDDILDLYATIGKRLKQQFVGNEAWVLSSHEECFQSIGFRPSTKIALYNGALPCELRKYQVFDGRLSDRREEGLEIKTEEERRRNAKFRPHRPKDDDSDFDGRSWRPGGSRDDEHYFKARPDRQPRRDDRSDRPRRKPLFEGDGEPELNIHNFKWGDRSANYRHNEGEEKSQREADNRRSRHDDRSDRPRRDDRPRREERRNREDRAFRNDRDDRFYRDERRGRDHRDDRRGRSEKSRDRWGFDEEGRPFRRDDD